jgi:hypothetical protein
MGSGHAGWGVQIIDHFPDASQIHAAFFALSKLQFPMLAASVHLALQQSR